MNHYQQSVHAFHIALGIPAPDAPTQLPPDRVALRIRLLREEVEEFAEAAPAGDLIATIHELCDSGMQGALVVGGGVVGVEPPPLLALMDATAESS